MGFFVFCFTKVNFQRATVRRGAPSCVGGRGTSFLTCTRPSPKKDLVTPHFFSHLKILADLITETDAFTLSLL